MRRFRTFCAACALALLAAPALAAIQDGPRPSAAEVHQEIERLFRTVERSLHRIDRLLVEAPAPSRAGPTLAERLGDSVARSRDVQRDIDRILELARSDHHPPGSGGS